MARARDLTTEEMVGMAVDALRVTVSHLSMHGIDSEAVYVASLVLAHAFEVSFKDKYDKADLEKMKSVAHKLADRTTMTNIFESEGP